MAIHEILLEKRVDDTNVEPANQYSLKAVSV